VSQPSTDRRPLRIAIGALLFEGNTFSPLINRMVDFRNKYFLSGEELVAGLRDGQVEMSGAIEVLEAHGTQIVPLFATHGGAGGRVGKEDWAELKERLLAPLRSAEPVDGVYLALHGAMVCEDEDDPEGVLLREARAIVGDVPIAMSIDLHGHVTRAMAERATFIIAYRQYPHDDVRETGMRAAGLLMETLHGTVRPTMSVWKAPLVVPAPRQRTHGDTPMADFFRAARDHEAREGVLSVSYVPVQPWLDLPEVGFTAVAVTDNDPREADRIARELVREAWRRKDEFDVPLHSPAEAIAQGRALPPGMVILSDVADCVGGGGAGDSAVVLRALLEAGEETNGGADGERGAEEESTILIVDPETVRAAEQAGLGQRFDASIGNKLTDWGGPPVEAEAEVVRLFEGSFDYKGGILAGGTATMGPSAVLRVGGVQVVVSTHSSYEYAEEQFEAAGIDPRACRFVVVKNPMNYQTAYADAVGMFVLDTPGATPCNLAGLPWRRIDRPLHPVDTDFEPDL